ncbi:metallo-beta-lactamase family protein [Marinobacter persicus]|uniref:Metallo-beta-lactamase family protein n=1 Tax=Marinobacter persicus TaxID=930118 RepID=A0A1I3PGM7_9GAMM|nr:MBL fold metallo-hydrolase [Marinobacter persicus]GHD53786.1 MBL fold hydrolase [Marinobacter persicus]SFJ20571.1 metallo-beta-lactamase family protein [Marinobacter persicus]
MPETTEVQIEHHGAKTGVTGSCHQLHINPEISLLIDCGLFQGQEAGNTRNTQEIDFSTEGIQALIATHVHIDHVGRIPWLLAAGYTGPIICSRPSAKLLPLVLEDAFKLGISRDRQLVEQYLATIEQRLLPLPYNQWHTVIDTPEHRVSIRLQRAGHILGSAYVEVDHNGTRIVFSGDLGASHTPLLPAPEPPEKADVLVLESTYGDRNHESREDRKHRLNAAIDRALQNQGTVLIPAFSIGRTQELLYELEEIISDELPVILDSPLAAKFTAAYRELQPYWDEEAHARLQQGRKPLGFDNLLTVEGHHEHLKMVHHLARSARPAIVIAGSGMCNAGRIVNYLKAMLNDERHDVLFVGYQAEGTPGRDIQRYGPDNGYVWLDDEKHTIRARVETIGGYSAHADQQGLVNFIKGMRRRPEDIRLVHGEEHAKQALRAKLANK